MRITLEQLFAHLGILEGRVFIYARDTEPEVCAPNGKSSWDALVNPHYAMQIAIHYSAHNPPARLNKARPCTSCPYLDKKGESFPFCALKLNTLGHPLRRNEKVPTEHSAEVQAHVGLAHLVDFCTGMYGLCPVYTREKHLDAKIV